MRLITAFAALLALAACSSRVGEAFDTRQNAGPCPPAGSLYDVSRIVEFNGDRKLYNNITYTGEIVGVDLFCRYAGSDDMEVELDVNFAFGKGAAGAANAHTFEYFVAVTRRNGKVLAKETFPIAADFSSGRVSAVSQNIRPITIPRVDESISGANFEVLVGFVMSEEQKMFNREGNRFRLETN